MGVLENDFDKEKNELLSFACDKFESGEYDTALGAFVLAYQKGYEQEWILDNIYRCYFAANEEEFRKAYQQWDVRSIVTYKECILDFIPYRDSEYYIYDKQKMIFRGVLSVHELQNIKQDAVLEDMEFSAVALVVDWDWRIVQQVLTAAVERKTYIICKDLKRCLSFWKIPELREYLSNIKIFSDFKEYQNYFHENTDQYLPKIFYGNEDQKKKFFEIGNEEHQYRLTPEGRNTENVLLTIAIPTYNRGHLLLKHIKNLLLMPYDAEVEIVVSKNGTQFYQEEYVQVSEIQDARINYFDHGKDLYFINNWHYAVEMSCGKYVLVISDEDQVIIEKLEHYFRLLSRYPDLCMVRPKSTVMYHHLDKREYGKKGWDAFRIAFLRQSHFPGLIVRRQDFIEADLLSLERFADNLYYRYYPHEWWCIMLSQRGDCMNEPVILCDDSEPIDHVEEWERMGLPTVPEWVTYDTRIGQFQGMVDLLTSVIKMEDKNLLEQFIELTINKTTLLFKSTRNSGYKLNNYQKMVEKFVEISIGIIQESLLDSVQKVRLLYKLNDYSKYLYVDE